MPERLRSLRARVTAAATLVVLVVLVLMAVVVVRVHRATLLDDLDETMEDSAEVLLDRALAGEGLPDELPGATDDDRAYELLSPTGRVLDVIGEIPDDGPLRVLTEEDDGVVVRVTASMEDADESSASLAGTFVPVVPLLTLLLGVGIWLVVGRALRPVEAIRAEVAAIGGTDLHRRVPEPPVDDEIGRLARTMNAMLARVEGAAEEQRRFVGDASHELRSPLTRIRTELEVDRAHPASADLGATAASVLDEVVGMQAMVEDLLHLARSDAGAADAGSVAPVDLRAVVLAAVEDLRAATGREVDTEAVEAVTVPGRAGALRRLVDNLLGNADRHASSQVSVALRAVGATVELVVADDGPGIPAADRERVFDRFTRLDAARTAGAGGTGLGLAIVRDIAERHGGTVAVGDAAPGARIVVVLPAGRAPRATWPAGRG